MNALPYLAGPATRHAWAEREYARLQADIVEATLIARARSAGRGRRIRRWLLDGVPDRIGARRHRRHPASPVAGCRRAAGRSARSAHALRTAEGVR
ncbi:hypothetical protein E1264_12455 [Actinomadura sp. KC216]|uniref:hypothetical protein n=1 Tax=Actinomadura sp. KC216 TaxID=2530370 RepID=UPI00104DA182|nr:hypothetical protein [Actinomadura sp. KC216]TDB88117.1 hypothetical protein E1264_12455 [Actinomadura sp. KC216]